MPQPFPHAKQHLHEQKPGWRLGGGGPRQSHPAARVLSSSAACAVEQRSVHINPPGCTGDGKRWLFRFLEMCECLKQTLPALSSIELFASVSQSVFSVESRSGFDVRRKHSFCEEPSLPCLLM